MKNTKTRLLVTALYLSSIGSLVLFLLGIHVGLEHLMPPLLASVLSLVYVATFGRYRVRYGFVPALAGFLIDFGFLKTAMFFVAPIIAFLAISVWINKYVGSFIFGERQNLKPDFDLLVITNAIARLNPGSAQDAKDVIAQLDKASPQADDGVASASIEPNTDQQIIAGLIGAIEDSRKHLPSSDPITYSLGNNIFDSLSETVRKKWQPQHIKNYVAKARAGHSHESFIYNALTHETANMLESGQNHVYRGVLNITGDGYRKLFEHSIERSVALSIYTDEWATENLRNPVYKNLKSVG